jgi:type II secretory pathway component PulM
MRRTILFLALVTVSVAQDKLILNAEPPKKPKQQPKQTSCAVQELYAIAWSTHDPAERHKAMLAWLDKSTCSADDYTAIWNALSEWAGTADSPALRAKIMEKAK